MLGVQTVNCSQFLSCTKQMTKEQKKENDFKYFFIHFYLEIQILSLFQELQNISKWDCKSCLQKTVC